MRWGLRSAGIWILLSALESKPHEQRGVVVTFFSWRSLARVETPLNLYPSICISLSAVTDE